VVVANNASDEMMVLNDLGFLEAGTPNEEAHQRAEEFYAKSLALDVKYDLARFPYVKNFQKTPTELSWATAIAPYDCAGAQRHFSEAMRYLGELTQSLDKDQINREAQTAFTSGIGAVTTCLPLATAPH
jgi:hypothetical protein